MQDQTDIAEFERRITSALERIGAGLDAFAAPALASPAHIAQTEVPAPEAGADAPGTDGAAPAARDTVARPSEQTIAANRRLQARVLTLQTELEDSRAANAKLSEALKTAQEHAAMPHSRGQADEKIEKMTRQLDVQGLELQRMRKSTVQLREHLRVLHEAAAAQMAEPQMINKAMMAELESLRATRHSETAEMDEILAELMPLIEEARSNG
tara:strand:- start:5152 stop:5787 length:636 start_codon:yes stop_codon:yes gene_type:complete